MTKMTYVRAQLRIWNPNAYSKKEVREAAIYIVGSVWPKPEDLAQAKSLL